MRSHECMGLVSSSHFKHYIRIVCHSIYIYIQYTLKLLGLIVLAGSTQASLGLSLDCHSIVICFSRRCKGVNILSLYTKKN